MELARKKRFYKATMWGSFDKPSHACQARCCPNRLYKQHQKSAKSLIILTLINYFGDDSEGQIRNVLDDDNPHGTELYKVEIKTYS